MLPGCTGALSQGPSGRQMSVIPGREDRRRDTISVYLASPLAPNPNQFRTYLSWGGEALGRALACAPIHTHSCPVYLGTPVQGEIRLLRLGLSFPQGMCQEGAR